MSEPKKDLYAASCNPPRRAKRPRGSANQLTTASSPQIRQLEPTVTSPVGNLQPRPILPKRTPPSAKSAGPNGSGSAPHTLQPSPESPDPSLSARPPSKRGRKPGPLSRSAREAQRRLNHSIIEKARRTKINNALATLKELVPLDYGKQPKSQNSSDDEDEGDGDDDDEEYGGEKKKQKSKPAGKKEEKEREYKLEILVRTVTFLQDLLNRVAVLEQENPICSRCSGNLDTTHSHSKAVVDTPMSPEWDNSPADSPDPQPSPPSKRARTERYTRELESIQGDSPSIMPREQNSESLLARNRLPSISSWLPETLLDPSIFNISPSSRVDHTRSSKGSIPPLQLPTPPSSTEFQPAVASMASTLSLPSSTSGAHKQVPSPLLTRTPEDEHAATMLLQISGGGAGSSPIFRPLPPSIMSPTEPLHISLPSSSGKINSRDAARRRDNTSIAVQTPSSLLGLMMPSTS
ncbi:hypothetical protein D9756_009779 [Leucocoprinus leucothites]|uniref:BHLH domain-containing protein n=1 Tax=Leucocoprinus leucothites TaxID=201217 RepID=A0A8H5FU72_9AGAR|nr:hypothetical protein D9756_009779 [Leucoagaricus leucothites]